MDNDEQYMKRCLELAANARSKGFSAVGSLIVRHGKIISEGSEGESSLPALLAHAEAVAIAKAVAVLRTKDMSACTLYTTVEPCAMCSYLIRQTGIKEVVFGIRTKSVGGASSCYPILTANDIPSWNPAPRVVEGILKEACEQILKK